MSDRLAERKIKNIVATGAKIVKEDICVGCKVCTIACPFGTINYVAQTGVFGKLLCVFERYLNSRIIGVYHDAFLREFSPLVELRLEGRYQITRCVTFHAGWTGIWIGNIARSSSMIDYAVPDMGINTGGNKQSLFMNGLTMGFDINR